MEILPDDTLLCVFKFLTPVPDLLQVAGTSQRFRRLALKSCLWRSVTIPEPIQACSLSDATDEVMAKQQAKRRRLAKGTSQSPVSAAITTVVRYAQTELRALDMSAFKPEVHNKVHPLNGVSLRWLSTHSGKNLEAFSCPPSRLIGPSDIELFVHNCPKLRSLAIRDIPRFDMKTLGRVIAEHQSIVRIAVCGCRGIRGTISSFWNAIEPVAPKLEALDVSGSMIKALPLDKMLVGCPLLEELVADQCSDLRFPERYSASEASAGTLWPNLWLLRFDGASHFPLRLLQVLFMRGTSLRALSACSTIVASNLNVFNSFRLPALEHLALSSQIVADEFFKETIIKRMSASLITLDLSKCSALTGAGLARDNSFPRLRKVNVSHTSFSQPALECLIRISPKLEWVCADSCRSIPDRNMRRNPLTYFRAACD